MRSTKAAPNLQGSTPLSPPKPFMRGPTGSRQATIIITGIPVLVTDVTPKLGFLSVTRPHLFFFQWHFQSSPPFGVEMFQDVCPVWYNDTQWWWQFFLGVSPRKRQGGLSNLGLRKSFPPLFPRWIKTLLPFFFLVSSSVPIPFFFNRKIKGSFRSFSFLSRAIFRFLNPGGNGHQQRP